MEKLSFQEWADILKSFYEDNGPEYKTATIEHIKETILTSPMAEETFIEDDEALEIAQQVHKIWENEEEEEEEEEKEKTKFNDARLFVEEFKNYLIGKTIYANGDKVIVKAVYADENDNVVKINYKDKNSGEETGLYITSDNFQNFIDGQEVNTENLGKIELVLQEENLYNKPEYKYYILDVPNKKILAGFEYKEDAYEQLEKSKQYDLAKTSLLSKKDLSQNLNINIDDNSNWEINFHDWAIIETCLNKCSDEGGCSPKEAAKYLKEFKEEGKHLNVIKGALLQCLERAQIKLRGAYAMSNLESVNEKCDENCRIQKELKRLIAMEK